MQGRSDIPLDDHGRAQADAAGRALAVAVWDGVVSSPFARARQTAAIVAAHLPNLSHDVDARLGERDYGEAEGLAVAEAYERWPSHDFPGSEPIEEVARRGAEAIRDLADEGRNAVVVAHGTLLRLAIGELTGTECPRILNGETLLLDRIGDGFRARRLA
ncbi:hypothetical protein GCM10010915_03990 [Microbacterium faecale]|uniref:Histidine phosphatase family protein n=2 Tax=Microbacterium faecale TaxID=1804630 RepID=A0A916Y1P2_9MICO|nr:hypothetical protein GCM10010915_03990 [Microbacterium faecale]